MALPWDQLSQVSGIETLVDSCVLLQLNLANESPDLMLKPSPASEVGANIITCAENPNLMGLDMREDFTGKKVKFESMILTEKDQQSLDVLVQFSIDTVQKCLI